MMRTLKSLNNEDDFDTERLIHESEDCSDPEDCQSDRASNYNDYQEASCIETDTRKTDVDSVNHSVPELDKAHGFGESEHTKNFLLFSREKFEVHNPEMFFPVQSRRQNFPPSYSEKNNTFGHVKSWNLLLRVLGNKLAPNGKVWRPVLVKLEENTLKFHAEAFESSPPFKVVNLTWFFSFRTPVQAQFIRDEFLFTTVLLNTFHATRGRFAKCGQLWKRNYGSKVKLGCANHSVLLDFIETIQKCVHSFPAFRQQGIRYRNEKVSVLVQDVYEVTQHEKDSVTVKQVHIMLKAKVSASPECSLHVKHAESFSKKPAIDEVSFHKCVQSRYLNNQTVAVRFLPLDNCWFHLMSWTSCSSRPPPLRCEVAVTVSGKSYLQLCARVFTGSTHLKVTSVSDVTLRFYIPSEWLETERKSAVQTLQQCTNVTQGIVSYNPNAETMLWSIPKLSFKPCRNFYLTGKPLASLSTQFKPPSYCNVQEIVKDKVPVEMCFSMKGSAQWSEVEITNMKLGLKLFGKFETGYSSLYRIVIPATCSVA